MTTPTPGWAIALRVVPSVFACGALGLAFRAYFHPMSAERILELEELRDPGGRIRKKELARVQAPRDILHNGVNDAESVDRRGSVSSESTGRWWGLWFQQSTKSSENTPQMPSKDEQIPVVDGR
jgi:hypothetical protein